LPFFAFSSVTVCVFDCSEFSDDFTLSSAFYVLNCSDSLFFGVSIFLATLSGSSTFVLSVVIGVFGRYSNRILGSNSESSEISLFLSFFCSLFSTGLG
jgi:choline-glycine betaine transporter